MTDGVVLRTDAKGRVVVTRDRRAALLEEFGKSELISLLCDMRQAPAAPGASCRSLHYYLGTEKIASWPINAATIMPSIIEQAASGCCCSAASSQHYGHLGIKNAIRPTALGKKNWLFVGQAKTGQRSAILYTIVESCRRRGIDPYAYLRDILTRLPTATNWQTYQLTPEAWARDRNTGQMAHAA